MKTKYTPGPWEVSGTFVGKSIPGEAYHLIVDAHPGAGRYDISEKTAANLKLIASAPELLESLQKAMETAWHGDKCAAKDPAKPCDCWHGKAIAAITKAIE